MFFSHIDSTLLMRWEILQSAIGTARYLINMFICRLIIPMAPTITGTVVILKCHLSQFLFPGLCVYLFCHSLWLLVQPYQFKDMFSFRVLNNYIWFIALYFSISLDCKVPVNSCSVCSCYWFCLVFIRFSQYFTISTYFPVTVMSYFICVRIGYPDTKRSFNSVFLFIQSTYWVWSIFYNVCPIVFCWLAQVLCCYY